MRLIERKILILPAIGKIAVRIDVDIRAKPSGAALDGLEGFDFASLPARDPLEMTGLEGGDFLHRLDLKLRLTQVRSSWRMVPTT